MKTPFNEEITIAAPGRFYLSKIKTPVVIGRRKAGKVRLKSPKAFVSKSSKRFEIESLLPIKTLITSPVTALPFNAQISIMMDWASRRQSKFVCAANVHMLIEAYEHKELASVLEKADLVTPDGMPLVWMMRQMGVPNQDRIAGMDIFLTLCQL